MMRLAYVTVLPVLYCSLAGGAQSPIADGLLAGTVRDSEGAVIKKAEVFIHWNCARAGGPKKTTDADKSRVTDRNGKFVLHLVPGFYDVYTHALAFSPSCETVRISAGQATLYEPHLRANPLIGAEFGDTFPGDQAAVQPLAPKPIH